MCYVLLSSLQLFVSDNYFVVSNQICFDKKRPPVDCMVKLDNCCHLHMCSSWLLLLYVVCNNVTMVLVDGLRTLNYTLSNVSKQNILHTSHVHKRNIAFLWNLELWTFEEKWVESLYLRCKNSMEWQNRIEKFINSNKLYQKTPIQSTQLYLSWIIISCMSSGGEKYYM